MLQAGIQDNRLLLALEPEAAAIYCKDVSVRKSDDSELISFEPGEQFVLIDLGGKTEYMYKQLEKIRVICNIVISPYFTL